MDASTVIEMLAAQLALSGLLFLGIAWATGRASGLVEWGAGCLAFGGGFLGRALDGAPAGHTASLAPDIAMLAGAVLFVHGLNRFLREDAHPRFATAAGLAAIALHVTSAAALGEAARSISLDAMLAIAYFAMTALAVEGRRADERLPLLAAGTVFAGLGTLSAGRAIGTLRHGAIAAERGDISAGYFSVASIGILLIGFALLWLVYSRMQRHIVQLEKRDPLTGLLNREGLRDALNARAVQRPNEPLVLLQVDLDEFRELNERWGYAFGDRMLVAVTAMLRSCVRQSDLLARTGGEEFVVACFGAANHARMLAERIGESVRQIDLRCGESPPISCSASIGISSPMPSPAGWERAFAEADDALYRAKRRGRNACVVFSDATG